MKPAGCSTDDRFWDCECPTHYIHVKNDDYCCPACGAHQSESPDARVEEIENPKLHYRKI